MYKYKKENNNWVKIVMNNGEEDMAREGEVLDTLREREDGRIRHRRSWILKEYLDKRQKIVYDTILDEIAVAVALNALDDSHRHQWVVEKLKNKGLSYVEMAVIENIVNPDEYEQPLDIYGFEYGYYEAQTNIYYKDVIRLYEKESPEHANIVKQLEKELAIFMLRKKRHEKSEYPNVKEKLSDLSLLEKEFVEDALLIHISKLEKEFKIKFLNIH